MIRLTDIIRFLPVQSEPLCEKCKEECVLLQSVKTCRGCGRRWEDETLCGDCTRWNQLYPDYHFCNEALYEYNAFMKEWMEKYKFQGDYRMRAVFAEPLRNKIEQRAQKDCLIVPIPISQKSLSIRGFNQVTGLLDAAQISYSEVLTHIGTGAKQSAKDRKQRMTSPQPFILTESQTHRVERQSILLIDDVYTTGRTIFHAAECLFAHGAKEVNSITVAR